MADSVVSLGLDLSAFEAVLKQGFEGLGKGAQKALAEAKTAAALAAREATAAFREQQRAQTSAAREAAKAIKEQEAAAKAAAAESERAAREATKAAEEAKKQTAEGLKGLGELLGLPVDKVEKLGQAFGLVGGPLAAVAGGAAIATAALALTAGAVYGLVAAAIDLEKEIGPLREQGLLPPLDPAFTANLTEAEQAMAGAGAASKALVVQIGAQLAPAVEYAAVVVSGMVTSVLKSGLSLADFGRYVRSGVVVVLQSLVDWALMIPTIYARMAGLVGSALESLGFESLGGKIREVTDDALAFKNSIGELVGGGLVDQWAVGLTLMGREADVAGAATRRLGAAALALADKPEHVKKLKDETAKLKKEAEAAAKASAEWAREQGMVNAAAQGLAGVAAELEALIPLLEKAAAAELDKTWAAAEQGAKDYAAAVKDLVTQPIRDARDAAKGVASQLSAAAGIDVTAFTSLEGAATELLRISTMAAEGQIAAQEALKAARLEGIEAVAQAERDLAAAVATGDDSAIEAARAALAQAQVSAKQGVAEAKADLEAASPEKFIKGLMKGAVRMVTAIVDALPAVVQGIVDGAPKLINALIDALPQVVNSLAKAAPQIAIDLAAALAIELPIQMLLILPALIKALAEGFIGGFVSAASRIKRVIGDIFKEIATGGRADTRTFGDTPGPIRIGPSGARVSPGDYVVAARSREGLAAQVGGRGAAPSEVRVVLDVRDGPVRLGLARATTQTLARAQVGRDTSARRSPYG